jgi:hypothetical protein
MFELVRLTGGNAFILTGRKRLNLPRQHSYFRLTTFEFACTFHERLNCAENFLPREIAVCMHSMTTSVCILNITGSIVRLCFVPFDRTFNNTGADVQFVDFIIRRYGFRSLHSVNIFVRCERNIYLRRNSFKHIGDRQFLEILGISSK